ncbi:MAG: class I SAM-dependent methyltransferase [Solirubrobacterales bacterium]
MTEQALYLETRQEEYALGLGAQGVRPAPPHELMEYGEPAEQHLQKGERDVASMLTALQRSGFQWKRCQRALEFGCSNGRLTRWLEPFVKGREIWGVDIQAEKVMWAMENLSPPFRFATTTTVPHLPFPDGHFGLVYAGSIFTHLGELHVAWLAELVRVLAPGGFLYITLHDERAVRILLEEPDRERLKNQIKNSRFFAELSELDFNFVSIAPYGNAMLSMVMMSERYARHIAQPLQLVGTFPRAFGFQTGYVFTTG